ncbi:MAG: MATE family efflux transporter [Phycisphaerales bacterium]|nr:MATE family efflux transporter [Phycisphaerales bacterium]
MSGPATNDSGKTPASPLAELLRIAGPTVATMTSYTIMTFCDKWLVSRLGPEYVGAQGNGGLAAWVPQSIAMGLFGVINTYVSQNLGAGKPERGAPYAWNGLWMAAAWWVLLLPYAFALPWIFNVAGMDPHQAAWATTYGQILLFGSLLNMWTRALSQFFYGLHKASIVMIAGVAANIVNLLVSAVLVFGNGPVPAGLGPFGDLVSGIATGLGIPPIGIAGSAYGTVIATAVELAIPMLFFLSPGMDAKYRTRSAWRVSSRHIKDLLRIGWPGGLMFGNEMVCWGFFMVYLVSHFGEQHASAGWIAHQYMSLSFMPAVGISVACTAIVGKYMGMKKPEIAEKRAWLAMKLALGYMGLCGIIFVVFRGPLVRLFIEDGTSAGQAAELVRLGSLMLIATACFQLFDAIAMVMSGALRGAGDTVFPGLATVAASWLVIVGGGTAMVTYVPSLESLGAWIAAASYIFSLCVLLLGRFLTGKWKLIRLVDRAEPVQAAGLTTDGVV